MTSENDVLLTRRHINAVITDALSREFDDPTIEISNIDPRNIRIRVAGEQGPKYWRVQIIEEQ